MSRSLLVGGDDHGYHNASRQKILCMGITTAEWASFMVSKDRLTGQRFRGQDRDVVRALGEFVRLCKELLQAGAWWHERCAPGLDEGSHVRLQRHAARLSLYQHALFHLGLQIECNRHASPSCPVG